MAHSNMSRANALLAWLLVLFILATPLGLGGNRPQFWLINFGALALIASLYLWRAARSGSDFARPDAIAPGGAALWVLAIAYPSVIILSAALRGLGGADVAWVTEGFGLLRVLSYLLFGWLCLQALRNERRARVTARAAVAGLAALAAYGLLAVETPEYLLYEKLSYDGVATGPFVNRNSFATFLALSAALSLALALTPGSSGRRRARTQANPLNLDKIIGGALAFAPVPLFLATCLLTGSRMGLFVTFLGLAVVAMLGSRATRTGRVALAGLLAASAIALVLAFTLLFGQTTFDRLGSTGASADVRWSLYATVTDMISAAPLLGHGFDSFPEAYRQFHAPPVSVDLRWDQAHNTYLELWSELGLLAGSVPILICLSALALLWGRIREGGRPMGYPAAGIAAIAIGAVHSLVDFSLEMPANVYLFIFLIALGLAPRAREGAR